MIVWLSPLGAQQLLDRIVARVDGYAITLTDVNAALELGVIEAPPDDTRMAVATQRMIERRLVLAEVARFAPPEPETAAIDRAVDLMRGRVGERLDAVMTSTGIDQVRIRELARDTLRIQAYLSQRFGTTVRVSNEEVARYYRTHPDEFTRNGTLMPLEEAEPVARQRAAAERRAATIDQWLRNLRARAEVVEPGRQ